MNVKHPLIKKLLDHYREISLLGKVKATLDWDLNVNLPQKASSGRAEQSTYITELITKLWLDSAFRSNLEKATENQVEFADEEKAIVRNLNYAGNIISVCHPILLVKRRK